MSHDLPWQNPIAVTKHHVRYPSYVVPASGGRKRIPQEERNNRGEIHHPLKWMEQITSSKQKPNDCPEK